MRRKTHSSWLGLLADGSFRPLWPQRATITNMLQPLRGRSTQPLPNRGFTHVHHNYPAPCNREYPYRKKEIPAQACSKATRADMRAALRVPLWEICRSAVDASPFHGEAASLFSSSRFSEVNLTDSNWLISSCNCHNSSIDMAARFSFLLNRYFPAFATRSYLTVTGELSSKCAEGKRLDVALFS
jgi:hypothetical protein